MTSHDLRCPTCGAHAVAGADWCTLCFADLRHPAEPEPVASVNAALVAVTPDAGAPAIGATRTRGKHARRSATEPNTGAAVGDGEDRAAGVDVDLMLAQLAAQTAAPLGSFMDRFESKGSRVLVVCAGVAAVGLVLLLVMTMLGSLL